MHPHAPDEVRQAAVSDHATLPAIRRRPAVDLYSTLGQNACLALTSTSSTRSRNSTACRPRWPGRSSATW